MIKEINRGLYTDVVDIRRKVFIETARIILGNDIKNLSKIKEEVAKIPYKIIACQDPAYRCCVFRERAIVSERVRLSLGLPLWQGELNGPAWTGIERALKSDKLADKEIVTVIPEACEKCPTKSYIVTNSCKKCLAHPCSLVCPVDAIYFTDNQANVDQEKCIKCGRCKEACPYNAIILSHRPCAVACGVNAIESDESGRAVINHDKCVKCGMCIVACPFGAIGDKSEFVQMLVAMKEKRKVYAIIAPSFVGQFGPMVSPGRIISAIKQIGFYDIMEVAYGADSATLKESKEWLEKVGHGDLDFLGTSCCPAWVEMAKNLFPQYKDKISDSFTPMVETAKVILEKDPDAVITFIGPCTAKKAEILRDEVFEYVDFVITFEELAAIFVARDIDLAEITTNTNLQDASGSGRHYAVSGGVADALRIAIENTDPSVKVKIAKADTLVECQKMIRLAGAGKLDANLLEGMACPGGCVGGAGILSPARRTKSDVAKFAQASTYYEPFLNERVVKATQKKETIET